MTSRAGVFTGFDTKCLVKSSNKVATSSKIILPTIAALFNFSVAIKTARPTKGALQVLNKQKDAKARF